MATYKWKVKESSSFSVHEAGFSLVFSMSQNPEEVGSIASEGVDLLVRMRANRQKKKAFFLCILLYRPRSEGVSQIKDVYTLLKRSGLKVYFLAKGLDYK